MYEIAVLCFICGVLQSSVVFLMAMYSKSSRWCFFYSLYNVIGRILPFRTRDAHHKAMCHYRALVCLPGREANASTTSPWRSSWIHKSGSTRLAMLTYVIDCIMKCYITLCDVCSTRSAEAPGPWIIDVVMSILTRFDQSCTLDIRVDAMIFASSICGWWRWFVVGTPTSSACVSRASGTNWDCR